MTDNGKTKEAVLAVMERFMEAYRTRDIDALLALTPADDDLFLFGTGRDERRVGREEFRYQAERDWSQTDELDFNLTDYRISSAGPVAWVAAEGVGQGRVNGQVFEFPMRMTSVLKKEGDEWCMVQSHVSLPAPEQEEGDSVPV
jgi:ketosteroid isomerase-like protein